MSQIKSVIPREDYLLEVLFDNGNSIILNFAKRLNTVRFGMLEDKAFFRCVTTDGILIKWEDKIEISANELFQMVQR